MYFINLLTVTEIKNHYRRLCSIYHPDKGGDVETMKEINVQYKQALKACDGTTTQGTDNKEHTYHYNDDIEQAIIDKINELLSVNMHDVEIALIGTWIWITGETKQYKETLKETKCKWHSQRKCWFFSTQKKSRYNSKASLSDLANSYGYHTFDTQTAIGA